jgi:hypothetical protein
MFGLRGTLVKPALFYILLARPHFMPTVRLLKATTASLTSIDSRGIAQKSEFSLWLLSNMLLAIGRRTVPAKPGNSSGQPMSLSAVRSQWQRCQSNIVPSSHSEANKIPMSADLALITITLVKR